MRTIIVIVKQESDSIIYLNWAVQAFNYYLSHYSHADMNTDFTKKNEFF